MTSTSSDQKLPSFISAIAKIRCESASRTRVDSLACPAGGPSRTLITFDCGFFSLKTWIARTWSSAVIGLSTVTSIATELPFSTSGGSRSVTLPLRSAAGPTAFLIAACMVSGVARASVTGRTVIIPPAKLGAAINNWRRFALSSVVMVMFCLPRTTRRSFPRKGESSKKDLGLRFRGDERLGCHDQLHALITQGYQIGHHVLDLLGRQHRLAR